ncbi:uncharacterized protein LOC124909803 [Impatiens glandulifera]|uniref:uncharacterized protein LOC124909803 n=1 Tax=Impatiens glandulifera TaxID=253017 RepID=UPI001FB165A2|nr:uncharacterized protein LOC124909803 [Impatiens glandulifera]
MDIDGGVNDHKESENLVYSMELPNDHVLLKERIVSHPLYDLLVNAHLNLLKESYCKVLDKLKEEMEKPMQETSDFIETMYSELSSIVGPSSTSDHH